MPRKQNPIRQWWNKSKFPILNFINRQISNFRNNRLFNYIKEFYPVPIYLYSDATAEYVREFNPTWNPKYKQWEAEILLVTDYKFAKNYMDAWFFERKAILKSINEATANDSDQRHFRWKKIVELDFNLTVPIGEDFLGRQ